MYDEDTRWWWLFCDVPSSLCFNLYKQALSHTLAFLESCAPGWCPFPAHKYPGHPNSGRCYRHFDKQYYDPLTIRLPWTAARSTCRSHHNGDLASIQDLKTNNFVARVAPGFVWIGASRGSGRWQWSDGSPWHYTNWAHGQPGNEMYVAMTWRGDFGLWYTFGNNGKPMGSQYYTPGFVCQYDGNGGVKGTHIQYKIHDTRPLAISASKTTYSRL